MAEKGLRQRGPESWEAWVWSPRDGKSRDRLDPRRSRVLVGSASWSARRVSDSVRAIAASSSASRREAHPDLLMCDQADP
jgi:hypothetical protein